MKSALSVCLLCCVATAVSGESLLFVWLLLVLVESLQPADEELLVKSTLEVFWYI